MSDTFLDYLEDILDAMEKAEALIQGISYTDFEADYRINFAAVRALEIIGEATKRLPPHVRDANPDVPWKDMAGMRDRLSHAYDAVNLRLVWDTIKRRIPPLKLLIAEIITSYHE